MKSKKTLTRIIAMVLCVLSVTALLPTVAFAAEPKSDAVAAVANEIANDVKANTKQTVYVGWRYYCKVSQYWYDQYGRYIAVKFQWQVKKGSGRSYQNIRGANSYIYYYTVKKNMNGWKFRCKITGKYVRTQPVFKYFCTLRVRYW